MSLQQRSVLSFFLSVRATWNSNKEGGGGREGGWYYFKISKHTAKYLERYTLKMTGIPLIVLFPSSAFLTVKTQHVLIKVIPQFMLTMLPETQVAFFFFCPCSVLGRVGCRRNRKWRVWGLSVHADPPADREAAGASARALRCEVMGSKPRCCASQQDTSQSKQCKWF